MTTKPVPITCTQCGQRLAEALPGSIARCPNCGTWSGTTERPRLPRRPRPPAQHRGRRPVGRDLDAFVALLDIKRGMPE